MHSLIFAGGDVKTDLCSELPSNLVLKKISPKVWLPLLTTVWGILSMCLGFVEGFGSFVTVRALLGVAEGGLLPGMVLYLSHFYKRTELAVRIGIFYTAASLSGAFWPCTTSLPTPSMGRRRASARSARASTSARAQLSSQAADVSAGSKHRDGDTGLVTRPL